MYKLSIVALMCLVAEGFFSSMLAMNVGSCENDEFPLHAAAAQGSRSRLESILKNASTYELDEYNYFGRTPLDEAYIHGKSRAITCLLSHGACGNVVDFDKDAIIQELFAIKRRKDLDYKNIADSSACVVLTPELAPRLFAFLHIQINAMAYDMARGNGKKYIKLSSISLYLCCSRCVHKRKSLGEGVVYELDYSSFNSFFIGGKKKYIIGLGIDALLLFFLSYYKPYCYYPTLAHEYGHFLDFILGVVKDEKISVQSDSLYEKTKLQEHEYFADSFAHIFVDDPELSFKNHIASELAILFFSFYYKTYQDILLHEADADISIIFNDVMTLVQDFLQFMVRCDINIGYLKKISHEECFFACIQECANRAFIEIERHDYGDVHRCNRTIFSDALDALYPFICAKNCEQRNNFYDHPSMINRIKYIYIDLVFSDVYRWFSVFKKKYEKEGVLRVALESALHSKGIAVVPLWKKDQQDGRVIEGACSSIVILVGAETVFERCCLLDNRVDVAQSLRCEIQAIIERYYERVGVHQDEFVDTEMESIAYESISEHDDSHCCSLLCALFGACACAAPFFLS